MAQADALAALHASPKLEIKSSDMDTQTDLPNLDSNEESEAGSDTDEPTDFRQDKPPRVFAEARYDSNGNMLGIW